MADQYRNPGAPGMIVAAIRQAQAALLPPGRTYLDRAIASVEALDRLDLLRRDLFRAGATAPGEDLSNRLDAIRTEIADRLDEALAFGADENDPASDHDPADLQPVEVCNVLPLDGSNLDRGDLIALPSAVARYLRDRGRVRFLPANFNTRGH